MSFAKQPQKLSRMPLLGFLVVRPPVLKRLFTPRVDRGRLCFPCSLSVPTRLRAPESTSSYFSTFKMSMYPYRVLDLPRETRVLTLLPGEYSEPLACSLDHMQLSPNATEYEALSYCWGLPTFRVPPDPDLEVACAVYDPTGEQSETRSLPFKELLNYPNYQHLYYMVGGPRLPEQIQCDGVEVTIGGELHAALKHMRDRDKSRKLWVDALCINQSDTAERNEHVKMMAMIYAKATGVRIWLGQQTAENMPGLEALHIINDTFSDLYSEKSPELWERGEFQYRFINDKRISRLRWQALDELFQSAWVCSFPTALQTTRRSFSYL
jgi:hypothetical protein